MPSQRGNRGVTLIELAAGLAIATLLSALLYAGMMKMLEIARRTDCVGNLRQWGVALVLYMQDHEGRIPRRGQGVRPLALIDRPDDWFNCLPPYLDMPPYSELVREGRQPKPGERSVFVCPAAVDSGHAHFISYGMNMYLSPWMRPDMHRIQEIPAPAQLAFLADGPCGWASTVPSSQDYSVSARHGGFANVLFVDGHVLSFRGDDLGCGKGAQSRPDIRWATQTGGMNQAPVP
jgi:prepilin-type processing-associated H-X9-DG protein/prepilin-type N-terminal cleavage/methylation domain-containing protein